MCLLRKRVIRENNEDDVVWSNTRGTLAAEARELMRQTGWKEKGKWRWNTLSRT